MLAIFCTRVLLKRVISKRFRNDVNAVLKGAEDGEAHGTAIVLNKVADGEAGGFGFGDASAPPRSGDGAAGAPTA